MLKDEPEIQDQLANECGYLKVSRFECIAARSGFYFSPCFPPEEVHIVHFNDVYNLQPQHKDLGEKWEGSAKKRFGP